MNPMFNFQIESSPTPPAHGPAANVMNAEAVDLLRQLVDLQKEQLALIRNNNPAHDMGARWKAFMNRWQTEFPELPQTCRKAVPILEQCYGKLIAELTDHLSSNGSDALDNDFALQ